MSKKKTDRDYWYSDIDVYQLLIEKSQDNTAYKVIEPASHDYTLQVDHNNIDQTLLALRISEAIEFLSSRSNINSAVIPINLGNKNNEGIWEGRHWVGLSIRRDENNLLEAVYANSMGCKNITKQLPFLTQILNNHGIDDTHIFYNIPSQQTNGYDCGPWTVFNLDSLARNGEFPINITSDAIDRQRTTLNPYYDDSSDEEADALKISKNDLSWISNKFTATAQQALISQAPRAKLLEVPLEDLKISFLLHELGIRLLKSVPVNKTYYSLKEYKLQKTLDLTKNNFDKRINEGLIQILQKEFNITKDTLEDFIKAIRNVEPYHKVFLEAQQELRGNNSFIINRKLLPNKCVLKEDYHILDWLAYIRLINCSTKRDIRNIDDSVQKGENITAESKSFSGIVLDIPITGHHIDLHYKSEKTGSKTGHIRNIGKYEQIELTIDNIKTKCKIGDAQIAGLIKDVLNNNLEQNETYVNNKHNKSLVKYITILTGLLFLEEAQRNPSSLLFHHMILDLVQSNIWEWQKALEKMPMSSVGATTASIWTNLHYNTTIKYNYDCRSKLAKPNKELTTLIQKERELLECWLQWKEPNISIKKGEFLNILNVLLNACKIWYEIELKDSFVSNEYLENTCIELIDYVKNNSDQDFDISVQELRYFNLLDLLQLTTIIQYCDRELLDTIAELKIDITSILHILCELKDNINPKKELKEFLDYSEISDLLEAGLDIQEIFELDQNSSYNNNHLQIMATNGIELARISEWPLSEILELYNNNTTLFWRLVNDDDSQHGLHLIEKHGFEGAIELIEAASNKRQAYRKVEGYEPGESDPEEDSYDEAGYSSPNYHYHSDDSQNPCDCSRDETGDERNYNNDLYHLFFYGDEEYYF